ncbi:hypothetical protein C8R45DRAFT_495861 [Mycena sanguinolenta]|nr:hypothetical protein C8R45DRAFT_495861 [Mycena sanguinolenta]
MRKDESQVSATHTCLLSIRRVSFLLAALPSFNGPYSVSLTTYIPNSDANARSARCTTSPPARSSPLAPRISHCALVHNARACLPVVSDASYPNQFPSQALYLMRAQPSEIAQPALDFPRTTAFDFDSYMVIGWVRQAYLHGCCLYVYRCD